MAGFDHVQFNSFTGVPNIGDERNFLTAKVSGAATTGFSDPLNTVKSGDELLVRVYVHNNADSSLNANGTGVAKNTRVRVALPTGMAQNQTASAFISADNAQPQIIEDGLNITASTPVSLQYVPGSATINNKFQDKPLSDAIVTDGVAIGSEDLGGNFKGCFEYAASVTFKVKVSAPGYTLTKNVRASGATTAFVEEQTAKPGDKVEFNLGFQNTGTTELKNVVIGDRLPVGLAYVPGTTQWISGHTNGQWTKITNEDWMKGGLNVGAYLPKGTVLIRFQAQVTDASKLECGVNQIVNHGFAKPEGQGTIQDSATVKVTKECATTPTTTPVYSCDLLDVTTAADRTVTVKDFKYAAKDGAAFKHVVLNWGDGSEAMVTTANGQKHQYAKDGTYTIKAVPTFTVNGKDVTANGANCAKTVQFTTPVTPAAAVTPTTPAALPNVGAGNIAGIFAAVTVVATTAHRLFVSRRLAR